MNTKLDHTSFPLESTHGFKVTGWWPSWILWHPNTFIQYMTAEIESYTTKTYITI